MAIGLTQGRRNRKQARRDDRAGVQSEAEIRAQEEARQAEIRREEQQRAIFQTTEGQGIAETASISLGFEEDEDDLFDFGTGTGLVI